MAATALENTLLFIARINKVLSHTAAKDRLIRLIQYLMKFLSFSMSLPEAAAKARSLEQLLIDARKVFRFLRFMESIVNMQKLFTSLQLTARVTAATPAISKGSISTRSNQGHHQVSLKVLQLLQQCGLFGFFLTDHALLLSKLSITSHDPIFLRQLFGGMWLASCLSGVGADLLRLQELHACVPLDEPGDACAMSPSQTVISCNSSPPTATVDTLNYSKKHKIAIFENRVDLILNGLNAFIALNLSKRDMPHNRGVVGVCGMVTSSIQLWQIYRTHTGGSSLAERLEVPSCAEGIRREETK